MGAQAGIFEFGGVSPDPAALDRLHDSIQPWGPDGSHVIHDGLVAMLASVLVVDKPRLLHSHAWCRTDRVSITWDGRLDNRTDIICTLGPAYARASDAELVAAGFEQWGVSIFPRLVGDWSVAIWDRLARTLYLARDYMGVRPLFYSADAAQMLWCTTLDGFPSDMTSDDQLDPRFIVGFLTWGCPPSTTPYKRIHPVDAGTFISVTQAGAVHTHQYCMLGRGTIRYRSLDDYGAHMRQLFLEAVRCRLDSQMPTFCELSGGLDSSAVFCAAAQLLEDADLLRGVSYVSEHSHETSELPFIKAVETFTSRRTTLINIDDLPAVPQPAYAAPASTSPPRLEAARVMREAGSRVLLSGRVGDTVMGNARDDLGLFLELLAAGSLRVFYHALYAYCLATKHPALSVAGRLSVECLPPGLVTWLQRRRAVRRQRNRRADASDTRTLFSLTSPLATLFDDLYPMYGRDYVGTVGRAKRDMYATLSRYMAKSSLQAGHELPDVCCTHPFVHRPLVEFVLSIPASVLISPRMPRGLMRHALRGLMPPKVLERRGKGYIAPFMFRRFRDVTAIELMNVTSLSVVRAAFVDPDSLKVRLRAVMEGSSGNLGNLPAIAELETWLRARHTFNLTGRSASHVKGGERHAVSEA